MEFENKNFENVVYINPYMRLTDGELHRGIDDILTEMHRLESVIEAMIQEAQRRKLYGPTDEGA